MNNKKKGARGEAQAIRYLQNRGYKIIAQNVYTPTGEIDIIAEEAGELVFIEVKARYSEKYGQITEQIDARKQERLKRSAQHFLWQQAPDSARGQRGTRFDYIGLIHKKGDMHLEHIKNIID